MTGEPWLATVGTAGPQTEVSVVTDERGVYRVNARAGVYRLRAELAGFRAVTREGLQLLVGEIVTVNLLMLEATATRSPAMIAGTAMGSWTWK